MKNKFFKKIGFFVLAIFVLFVGISLGAVLSLNKDAFSELGRALQSVKDVGDVPPFAEKEEDLFVSSPIEVLSGGGDLNFVSVRSGAPIPPRQVGEALSVDKFSAYALLVKDVASGAVLFEKNAYLSHPLASLTKLMSALVVEDGGRPSGDIDVSPLPMIDSHLPPGSARSAEELFEYSLVLSSNRAIESLALAKAGSREIFVKMMNQKAGELGLFSTVFVEPTGLDAGNLGTASDVARLFAEALNDPEIHAGLAKEKINKPDGTVGYNTNWLLLNWISHDFSLVSAGKTGHITEAGFNVVVRVLGKNGRALDVVVLGAKSQEERFTEARDLAVWAFEAYQWE